MHYGGLLNEVMLKLQIIWNRKEQRQWNRTMLATTNRLVLEENVFSADWAILNENVLCCFVSSIFHFFSLTLVSFVFLIIFIFNCRKYVLKFLHNNLLVIKQWHHCNVQSTNWHYLLIKLRKYHLKIKNKNQTQI